MAIANNCQSCTEFTEQMKVCVCVCLELCVSACLLENVHVEMCSFLPWQVRVLSDVDVEEEERIDHHFRNTAIAFTEISRMRQTVHLPPIFLEVYNLFYTFSCDYLLDMVYIDLGPHLTELFSKKWFAGATIPFVTKSHRYVFDRLQSGAALSTVDVTMQDYGSDFKHLKDKYFVSSSVFYTH